MERRQALKNLGWSFGAFVATPTAISILQSCGGASMESWLPSFHSEEQGKLLRKLVDGILPQADDFPSATGANVHLFMDRFFNEVVSEEDQAMIKADLDQIGNKLLESAGESDYENVTADQVDAFLNTNLKKSEEELEEREAKMNELFSSGTEFKDFPDELRVGMLLANIRGMAIWAYKQDMNVCKNILAYDPIPTTYIGCGDLQELSGGRIWAEAEG